MVTIKLMHVFIVVCVNRDGDGTNMKVCSDMLARHSPR